LEEIDLIRKWNVVLQDAFASMMKILSRGQAREGPKVVDEMGLVKIAAFRSEQRPIGRPFLAQEPEHLLEASNAVKQLGRNPDFLSEQLDEAALTKPRFPGRLTDCQARRRIRECIQSHSHRGMPLQAMEQMADERFLEQCKPGINGPNLAQARAEFVG
jgi:hypothetical protein